MPGSVQKRTLFLAGTNFTYIIMRGLCMVKYLMSCVGSKCWKSTGRI